MDEIIIPLNYDSELEIEVKNSELAVQIINDSSKTHENVKITLTSNIVDGIVAAEAKRMSFLGSIADKMGLGKTLGKGQIGEPMYNDVVEEYGNEIQHYANELNIEFTNNFRKDVENDVLADILIAGALSLMTKRSSRAGRSAEDSMKFGIGNYFGANATLVQGQRKAYGQDLENFSPEYTPVRDALLQGTENQRDVVNYIDEVYYYE